MPDPISEDDVAEVMGGTVPNMDFSRWHPLDHHWWEFGYCRGFHGGTRNHLELVWDYGQGINNVRDWWHQQIGCRWGHHTPQAYWQGRDILADRTASPTGYQCAYCSTDVDLTPSQ